MNKKVNCISEKIICHSTQGRPACNRANTKMFKRGKTPESSCTAVNYEKEIDNKEPLKKVWQNSSRCSR